MGNTKICKLDLSGQCLNHLDLRSNTSLKSLNIKDNHQLFDV